MDTSTETTTGVDIVRTYHQHLQGRGLRPTTIRAYTSWLSRLQADTDADLLDLSTEDLEAWLVTHQWAPASHAKAVQALHTSFGLDAEGDTTLDDFDGSGPVVIVVGSEGKGLSRLVRENCDAILSIPMAGPVESLNASVAAGVVLADIARRRRSS